MDHRGKESEVGINLKRRLGEGWDYECSGDWQIKDTVYCSFQFLPVTGSVSVMQMLLFDNFSQIFSSLLAAHNRKM